MLLTAGRPTPALGAPAHRNKGVALVLDGPGLVAWKHVGRQWKAWSSRWLSACLEFGGMLVSCILCPAMHQLELLVVRRKKISYSILILFELFVERRVVYHPW